MASLQNKQIDQTYAGLIKTNDEGAVAFTPKALQDGAGNNLPVEVGTSGVKFTGGLQLEKSNARFQITNPDFNRTTYPLGSSGFGTFYIDGEDQNGGSVFEIRQDRYGSAYYKNIHADQGESHVFQSINGSGASVPAKISMDTWDGTNNSNNWITGYNERITAGSYDSGTSDLTLTKPDGTDIVVNIPAGGGGGADQAEGQNITPALGGASQIYSIPWTLSGYSTTAARSFSGNDAMFIPFYAKPGETIDDFYFRIQTAQAGALMNVGLYKSYEATINVNQKVLMPEYVATLATNVDVSTTGKKSFTGLAQSLPSDAVGGLYWMAFLCDTSGVALTKWSNWVANERIIYADIYRGNGVDYAVGSMTLPTGQVNISSATASTDLSVDFAWTYQS